MGEKIKDLLGADAMFSKLYEAVPILTWHVSPSADGFTRMSIDFVERMPNYFDWQHMPPDCIGALKGALVYVDETLQGKTIELRSNETVLSTITLE